MLHEGGAKVSGAISIVTIASETSLDGRLLEGKETTGM
jgi:hypothetical protein